MLFLHPMNRFLPLLILILIALSGGSLYAQDKSATLFGTVTDEKGEPIEMVNVALKDYTVGTSTNRKGEYLLRIPVGRKIVVGFSSMGYEVIEMTFEFQKDTLYENNIVLKSKSEELGEVVVNTQNAQSSGNIVRINTQAVGKLTTVSGGVEGLIQTLPGVNMSNELSNQYSVRGGNFDENLVYVNDIEVYRPYLIRSGQQEGLSFVNPDMVSSIEFSAGGFDAKYGDKMSSVLDIKYHRPTEFEASASASLLGGTAHIENVSTNGKFTYNMGLRYKTFRYLFNSLNTKGSYNPTFLDYQGYFTYSLSDKVDFGFLGTASSSKYQFIPESGTSRTGTSFNQLSLYVYYEGQEVDRYRTYTGSAFLNYKPTRNSFLKFIASAYTTNEAETFDIIGYYLLNDVQNEGTAEQEDTSMNIGIGYYHEHGRNYFDAQVLSFSHKGGVKTDNHFLQWGFKFKQEYVDDRMREWEYRDSAGYSLPYSSDQVQLYYTAKTDYTQAEQRYTGYVQDSYTFPISIGKMMLTAGARAQYWTYNDHLTISPRFSASLATGIEHDIVTRFSFGWYHQPAFYREIKDLYGNINSDIQTPKSIQAVAGVDYSFVSWDRPFRMTFETYYKALKNLIPYQIENVRIRYLSNEVSNGYAVGADFKVNGEFVSGTQSWVSMSLMKTAEDIVGDRNPYGLPIGYIPRPNDQRFKFSAYFQDYLPGLPETF